MRVAIVGGSPSWVDAPFDDKDCQIWVLGNQLDRYEGKRVTRVFEIHNDLSNKPDGYAQWLVDQKVPLVTGEKFPISADHVSVYPMDEIRKIYTGFSSSPAYMMGLAIHEGAEEIEIYGVDMAVDDHEYFMQQPDMCAWIGIAMGRGIEVKIHPSSPLMRGTYMEGRDYDPDRRLWQSEFKQIADEHAQKGEAIRAQIRQLEIQEAAHEGARQAYERLAKTGRAWDSGQPVSLRQSIVMK